VIAASASIHAGWPTGRSDEAEMRAREHSRELALTAGAPD
jgi:hypothetical protein